MLAGIDWVVYVIMLWGGDDREVGRGYWETGEGKAGRRGELVEVDRGGFGACVVIGGDG